MDYYYWPKDQFGLPCQAELLYKIEVEREKFKRRHNANTIDTWRPQKRRNRV